MFAKVLAAVLELVPDKTDAVQVGPHGELLVFALVFLAAGALLGQGLVVQRQGQNNVAPYLAGVQLAVEAAKLNRMIAVKKAVQVQKMVPAIVIMAAAAFVVTRVPDILYRRHRLGFQPVHFIHQGRVHLLAEPHPFRLYLQSFVKKVVLAGDDVDKVSDAPGRMVGTVQVNMDVMQSFT
mgnify:CR=1 FL=1